MKPWLIKIHRRLLPQEANLGALPYVWLVYLSMFIVPLFFGDRPLWHVLVSVPVILVFLTLYFSGFRTHGPKILWHIAGILLLGISTTFYNAASSVFFVYAAAFAVNLWKPRQGIALVFSISAIAAGFSYLFQLPPYFYLPATLITILIGLVNIYEGELKKKNKLLKISQEELKTAAAATERERIARDLHDLIGHTFSLITMKSQLANKLIDIDLEKAKQELKDLEQISRTALTEVREAVTGFKQRDMATEISKAKILADAADITLSCTINYQPGTSDTNSVLAFVVREAMTNLVKHSDGTKCSIHTEQQGDQAILTIQDNGHPTPQSVKQGNGITGMKERITALRGHMDINLDQGFKLTVKVPAHA